MVLLSACMRSGPAPVPVPVPAGVASARPSCARLHPGVGASSLAVVRAGSTIALAEQRTSTGAPRLVAYVADADEPTLHTIDVDARRELTTTSLRGRPEQLLILADGRVAVTLRSANALEILEPAPTPDAALESRCVIATPTEPIALAATPDDATLLVTSGWGHALSAFDEARLTPRYQVALPRDPRAVIVSDDGARAFVAHVVEARMSIVDLATAEHDARRVDLRARQGSEDEVGVLRAGCQGFALTKVEPEHGSLLAKRMVDRVYAPMVSVSPGDGSESSGYGNESPSEVSEVAVVDASTERMLTRVAKISATGVAGDECLLPRAAVYDGGALYVTCFGIDSLVKLDARSLDPAHAELKRWRLAPGPSGVAIDHEHQRAVVWSQFEREVAIVDLAGDRPTEQLALARRAAGISASVALGRALFHRTGDARISADGRACASCHPDGREDALSWSTPDGVRQTPMLVGRVADTAPYGWSGSSERLESHLTKTFERLSGSGLPELELKALVDYISTIAPPISSSVSETTAQQQLIEHGQALFSAPETACATCHDADRAFADGLRHQVMVQASVVQAPGFDTPSLRFVGGTAPYFHDGRYATLDDVLTAPDHVMGSSKRLTRADRAALVAYLETL